MSETLLRESPLIEHLDVAGGSVRFAMTDLEMTEQAFTSCVNLRGDSDDPEFLETVAGVLGCVPPTRPNTVSAKQTLRILWLGPDEWLVLAQPGRETGLAEALRAALRGHHAAVTEVGHGHTVLRLTGPDARELLAMGCPLDLHPRHFGSGQCAQSHLAKALVILARVDDPPGFDVIVRRSYADYLWRWLQRVALDRER